MSAPKLATSERRDVTCARCKSATTTATVVTAALGPYRAVWLQSLPAGWWLLLGAGVDVHARCPACFDAGGLTDGQG